MSDCKVWAYTPEGDAFCDLRNQTSAMMAPQGYFSYSSRTRQNTDTWARVHNLQTKLLDALRRVPEADLKDDKRALIDELGRSGEVNIVHLIYQKKEYEGYAQDYEFSGTSMREHWASAYADTLRTLRHPEWLVRSSIKHGIAIHDLHREDPK